MLKKILFVGLLAISLTISAQEEENPQVMNSVDKLLSSDSRLSIGGYAQIDYNQPFGNNTYNTGILDVHRLVILFGYNFSDKTSFITEIEFEHVKEVFVEQAFLQHKINNQVNFRGGLMLVPMGIINELHEPSNFNGVERPFVDSYISPTTWREIGFGFTGNLIAPSIKYQLYVMNGFNGYDGDPNLSGSNGLRKGRQKGAKSFMSSPNFAFRTEYYGIRGLSAGLSGYFGMTQTSMFDGVSKNDNSVMQMVDSSRVGISMIGIDAVYSRSGFVLKGQYYFTSLSNTEQYNRFTADAGTDNDLGSKLSGYYVELGYNVFSKVENLDSELIPFLRYSTYNTHHEVAGTLTMNDAYLKNIITTGLTWKLSPGAALKCDIQFIKSGGTDTYSKTFNSGVAIMF